MVVERDIDIIMKSPIDWEVFREKKHPRDGGDRAPWHVYC